MKRVSLAVLLLSFAFYCLAQPETANWYFGNKAGIRFLDDTVIALTDGQMEAREGCTTISDRQGNLLFYSNGVKVWGRNHQVLPNGSDLLGDESSTQGALLVPHPSDRNLYYLFTTGAAEQGDDAVMAYSVIDRRLNNGKGDITVKNQVLLQQSTEKLCGIRHANGRDVWVVGHKMNTNAFYTYLVDQDGLVLTPVISNTGTVHNIPNPVPPDQWPNANALGYMKASPDGSKLAVAITYNNALELFNFDSNTGRLFFLTSLPEAFGYPYGLEFDTNSKRLYVGFHINEPLYGDPASELYEFDISKEIQRREDATLLGKSDSLNLFAWALQLGKNKRIYHTRPAVTYLGSINSESDISEYSDSTINLNNKLCKIGLPNFINSYPSVIGNSPACLSKEVTFSTTQTLVTDSVKWQVKDASNNVLTTSTEQSFTYTFQATGTYKALLTYYQSGDPDTALQSITIHDLPIVNLGADTLLYEGETLDLNIAQAGASYLWQDGSTTPNYAITAPGTYQTVLTDKYGCQATDTLKVRFTTIRIPNVFTPNGDGVNDQFVVEGIELHTWQMSIYNRLGKQVFFTDRYANNWAGKGSDAGIYYYSLTNPRLRKHFKGWVEILK